MSSTKVIFRKKSFTLFVIILVLAFYSEFELKINWKPIIKSILSYYGNISHGFNLIAFVLIFFRLVNIKPKMRAHEQRMFPSFGPFIDLTKGPLFAASLFYAAMFLLHVIFNEQGQVLPLSSLWILFFVAFLLILESIRNMHKLYRETFYTEAIEVAHARA